MRAVTVTLHVEDDAGRRDDLGGLVGTFLLHATDEQLAPLATVELACATPREWQARYDAAVAVRRSYVLQQLAGKLRA